MSSSINPLYPEAGSATTQSVRDNFSAAKGEIEALQSDKEDAGTAAAAVSAHELTYDHALIESALQPGDVPDQVSPPASPSASGSPGEWAWSSPYLYFCVASDTWVRWTPARTWT